MRLPATLLLCLLAVVLGCGTSHSLHRVGGLAVHTFTRDSTHAHVIAQGDSLLMIDSGYERNAAALDEALRDEGLDPSHVRAIVVTHGHADHAGGARYFQRRYGARVVAGAGDQRMFATGHNDPICPTGFIARRRRDSDQGAIYTPTPVDVTVDAPLDLAPLTGVDARVTPVPGHTPGSLVVTAGAAVFVGDLFRGAIVGDGAEVHFYMCDLAANRADVQRVLRDIAPAGRTFFPGHFGPVERDEVIETFGAPR